MSAGHSRAQSGVTHLRAGAEGNADEGAGHGAVRLRQRHLRAVGPEHLRVWKKRSQAMVVICSLEEPPDNRQGLDVLVDTVASQTPSAQPARVPAALGPASQSWCTRRRLVHQSRHVANVHPDAVWKGFQSHLTEGEGWRSGRRSQAIRGREHLAAALPQLLEVVPVAPLQVLL